MEINDIKKLIECYDDIQFYNLSEQEWYELTNHFDKEVIEMILLQEYDCNTDETDDDIIKDQLQMLKTIYNARSTIFYDDYTDCSDMKDDYHAHLSLFVRAGKYLRKNKIEVPTKKNNTPDYEAIQRMLNGYASAYQKMEDGLSVLQEKSCICKSS